MNEVRVYRDANNFCVMVPEFSSLFRELDDFSGADEGEVEWVKE
jgi:hypothetical protein